MARRKSKVDKTGLAGHPANRMTLRQRQRRTQEDGRLAPLREEAPRSRSEEIATPAK